MPAYVRVHGFLTDGVEYTEEADALESFFLDSDDHTDATLGEQLMLKLEATMPDVRAWALTSSVPWSGEYVLHIVSASRSTKLAFSRDIEAGADSRPRPPRGWGRLGPTELAQAILGESEPFPERLKEKTDWLARFTGSDVAQRDAALTAARRVAVPIARDDESRARKKALVGPVVEALSMLSDDDPARPELWDIASFSRPG